MTDASKRRAYESPGDLARPEREDPRMRRPAAIAVGAVLVGLRTLAGVLWLAALLAVSGDYVDAELGDDGLDLADADAQAVGMVVVGVLVIGGGILLLIELVLGVVVYFGVNWARITLLVLGTLSISGTFASWWAGDQEIHLDFTLVTLALDILVMLALSSEPARRYARRKERVRGTPDPRATARG
ncbi:hypothetical protein ACDF64_05710 [Agromyces sp. MMS24-JH15]|uniref:hypothetical protein n=1 Tax=Agromyces sp. MMS24-JH15 TaxID=3243765 RepID=UPI0037489839